MRRCERIPARLYLAYTAAAGVTFRHETGGGSPLTILQTAGGGCGIFDYDGDGRVDVVMTQNGNATKLYHNLRARSGVRIRLRGNGGNPTGIGAKLRLMAGEKKGPVREIHAGSGYWSQDSAVAVMNLSEPPTHVQVQWPNGKTMTVALPAGAREIEIEESGQLKQSR